MGIGMTEQAQVHETVEDLKPAAHIRCRQLDRTTLRTSRLLDFCSRKELIAQTGHQPDAWALVILKELIDNSLDACEEAGTEPMIAVQVDDTGITVADNGPGIPESTIEDVLDFTIRVSSREAYVAPDRGAQGNALKTLVAMPFVLDGERGRVDITANAVKHRVIFSVDVIRQEPVITHKTQKVAVITGSWRCLVARLGSRGGRSRIGLGRAAPRSCLVARRHRTR